MEIASNTLKILMDLIYQFNYFPGVHIINIGIVSIFILIFLIFRRKLQPIRPAIIATILYALFYFFLHFVILIAFGFSEPPILAPLIIVFIFLLPALPIIKTLTKANLKKNLSTAILIKLFPLIFITINMISLYLMYNFILINAINTYRPSPAYKESRDPAKIDSVMALIQSKNPIQYELIANLKGYDSAYYKSTLIMTLAYPDINRRSYLKCPQKTFTNTLGMSKTLKWNISTKEIKECISKKPQPPNNNLENMQIFEPSFQLSLESMGYVTNNFHFYFDEKQRIIHNTTNGLTILE